jgi:hypothetical protein
MDTLIELISILYEDNPIWLFGPILVFVYCIHQIFKMKNTVKPLYLFASLKPLVLSFILLLLYGLISLLRSDPTTGIAYIFYFIAEVVLYTILFTVLFFLIVILTAYNRRQTRLKRA